MERPVPYTITYNEIGYIVLSCSGTARLKDLSEAIVQGAPMVEQYNCYRVLSDFREMKLTLSIMDLFSIPATQAMLSEKLHMRYHWFRRAVLVPEADFEKYKFFENVAVNRFHVVKVFTEKAEAVSWLMEK